MRTFALLALLLAGCTGPGLARPAQHTPEWLSVTAAVIERDADGPDVLDDGLGYSLEGGLVFSRGPLRPSIELGYVYSNHDLEPATSLGSDLDVHRFLGGFRLEYDLESAPMTVWARAGLFYRWSSDSAFSAEPFDQDDEGGYVGGGLFFWSDERTAIGPFLTYYLGDDDDLAETQVGFSFVLRHEGSLSRLHGRY